MSCFNFIPDDDSIAQQKKYDEMIENIFNNSNIKMFQYFILQYFHHLGIRSRSRGEITVSYIPTEDKFTKRIQRIINYDFKISHSYRKIFTPAKAIKKFSITDEEICSEIKIDIDSLSFVDKVFLELFHNIEIIEPKFSHTEFKTTSFNLEFIGDKLNKIIVRHEQGEYQLPDTIIYEGNHKLNHLFQKTFLFDESVLVK